MKIVTRFVLAIVIVVLLAGCATTTMQTYHAAGKETVCDGKAGSLGYVAILPEVAWRKDQKEPKTRESMALDEIKNAFRYFPCGNLNPPSGVRAFFNWSSTSESALLKQLEKQGVDTVILLRIEELTPRIFFTFSLPFLWSGSNEADFRIRVLSVESGTVLTDMRIRRYTGGPFNIRPAKWSGEELYAALCEIIGKESIE